MPRKSTGTPAHRLHRPSGRAVVALGRKDFYLGAHGSEESRREYDRLIAGGLTPIRRWGTPEDVGRAVAAIARNLLPFSTGEVLNVDGGFHLRTL